MLDEIIRREDVSKLLVGLCNSARYYDKKINNYMGYHIYSSVELILFIFYDALYKYKIIIEDMDYFDDFLEQVDKLIRKIDNFTEISQGINRIIGRVCLFKLNYNDVEDEHVKETVIKYIYDRYIKNGYYIHGFSPRYCGSIADNGFLIEDYSNFYPKFKKVQDILKKKKHFNLMDKNFDEKTVVFTDNFVLGCYYSANSPMYFSKLLCRNEFLNEENLEEVNAYSEGDYDLCLKNLYKVMSKLKLNNYQKNIFLEAFRCEWELLDKSNIANMSLLLVPRKLFENRFDINEFLDDNKDSDLFECICKMLGQKNKVVVGKNINKEDFEIVNVGSYKKFVKEEKKETLERKLEKTFIRNDDDFAFSNAYGKVSILLLLGTVAITMGVILTMIMFS